LCFKWKYGREVKEIDGTAAIGRIFMLAVVESEGVLRQFFEKPNKRRIIRILVINNAQEWITSFNSYFQLNNLNIEDLKDSDSD